MARAGHGVPTLNISTTACAPSWVELKHSQMEATAHWGPQQKIEPPLFLFNLILLFDLYLSSHIQYPWVYIGPAKDCGTKNKAPLVCIHTGQISQKPGCTVDFSYAIYKTSESCRWCHAAPVLSICTVSLPVYQPSLPFRADGIEAKSNVSSESAYKCYQWSRTDSWN